MATIVTRTGKGSKLTIEEMDANFNNLNNKKAELQSDNTVSPSQLPSVYFSGMTGTGTISDPFIGGFSQGQLVDYLQGLPNWAPDRVLRGNLSWVDMVDNSLEQLATPSLGFGTATGDSIVINWTGVTNATTYTLQRDSSNAFASPVNIYSGSLFTFTDIGLDAVTTYYYRLRATASGFNGSNYVTGSKATGAAGNVTPPAPTMVADDTNDTLTISHSRGISEILVSVNNTTYVTLTGVTGWNGSTGKIDVGNVARAAGYYKAKTKSATGFNESPVANSDAFTTSVVTPSAPTSPVNDNTARTFDFTYTAGYTSPSNYEYSLDTGTTIATLTSKPLTVGSGAYNVGTVRVRVKAVAGVNNASAWLTNSVAFTVAPATTVALTQWNPSIISGTLSGNSLSFTSTTGFGQAISKYMIPAGGSGWVETTADTALNGAIIFDSGSTTYSNRNSAGTAAPLAMDYANSRFQCWVLGNDNFANPRPAFGANTKGRIRLDGTSAYFECSTDAGVTWSLMRTTTQPNVDLYVKAWASNGSTNCPINNIRGYNLTAV